MERLDLESLDDLALIKAFQEGDKEGLPTLLRRRKAWLYSIAKRTVTNASLAEDGLQEALVQIWKAADSFRGESQVTTWMYQIVVRSCIDVARKEKVRAADSLPEDAENLIAATSKFEARLIDEMFLHGALSELDPGQKMIITMVWIDGFSYEEVSDQLNIPLGTVKSRASRGMARLKEVISEILSENGNQKQLHHVKETEVKNVRHIRRRD